MLAVRSARSFMFSLLFLATAPFAHADAYHIEHIGNGNYQHAVNVDDFGNYVVDVTLPAITLGCNGTMLGMGQHCYESVFPSTGFSQVSTEPAGLWTDPHPIAGAGCVAAAGPETLISCVDGHPIYYVEDAGNDGFTFIGLYSTTNPTSYIHDSGSYDGWGVESQSGNFAYVDGLHEYVDLAINATTLATTPEPGSLWLVGTGVIGFMGAARRRFRG